MDRRDLTYKVAGIVLKHIPSGVDEATLGNITADLVLLLESLGEGADERAGHRLLVITAVGKNRPGVLHGVTEVLGDLGVDVLDVSQNLVRDNFAMMMMADPSSSQHDFATIQSRLKERGQRMGIEIFVQYEDLLRAVNRI
jgi:ACT domain-containing protein